MIVRLSFEVGTTVDFASIEVVPVAITCGEDERLADGFANGAHDCAHDVNLFVDTVSGVSPDSLEDEAIIDDLTVAFADEVD
mgnify:CR=1 FL=1